MVEKHSERRARVVVFLTALAAAGALTAAAAILPWALPSGRALAALVVFSVLYVLAEIHPIRAAGGAHFSEFTASATFAYALLLTVSVPLALVVITAGCFIADRRPGSRRPWSRTVFNASQVLLSFAVGGGVLHLLGATSLDGTAMPDLIVLALLPSGLSMYVTNVLLVGMVVAAAHGVPLRQVVSRDLQMYDLLSHFLLLGLAPVLVLVWSQNWLLTPLLLVAAFATYRSTEAAVAGQHASRHDPLTGLPNRRLFDERLTELTAARDGAFAAMLMDLDRFKTINDVMGHHVGDQLLTAAAERLQAIAGIDTVARVGGDEFAVIMRSDDDEDLLATASQIVETTTMPFEIQDVPLQVGASLGIARFPLHGHDAPSLMRRADSAMYLAKRTGGGIRLASPLVAADDDDPTEDPGRNSLLGDVEAGLALRQFRLDHQPQVDVATGQVVAVEALLRWDHPEHGAVAPSRFVPAIEHTELHSALTRHVLGLALEDQRTLAAAGFDLTVAVNISARDLLDMRLARDLAVLLDDADILADRLTLEITENALVVDLERAQQVIAELTDLGVGIALDDFGTGYASLGALRDLPVDELKIDRSFVAAMGTPSGSSIVRAMVGLGHDLGLHVVAEGIETRAELDELSSFGCDIAQGFLIARGLPRQRLIGWLRERQLGAAQSSSVPFDRGNYLQEVAG